MKRLALALTASVLALSMSSGNAANAAVPDCPSQVPIVSSSWLESHASMSNLVIIDVRTAADYGAGHISDSINIPFVTPLSTWITMRDDLLLELPATSDLFTALGSFGITKDSRVVLVTGANDPPYAQAGGTRVAITLMYAGLANVSILNGGYPKWVADGMTTTTDVPTITPVTFDGVANDAAFVDINYVHAAIGRTTIVDARAANVYSGAVVEPYANKAGHIPSAVSMPTPSLFNTDGTYKSPWDLAAIANNAIGYDRSKEVIVYCGVGGYASTALFVLTRVLGYQNVKFYDGSAQEWVKYYDMEL